MSSECRRLWESVRVRRPSAQVVTAELSGALSLPSAASAALARMATGSPMMSLSVRDGVGFERYRMRRDREQDQHPRPDKA